MLAHMYVNDENTLLSILAMLTKFWRYTYAFIHPMEDDQRLNPLVHAQ